ncbi:hypothetical protein [Chryseobacterium sp. CCH4-E10]|uniref:hypothetical protein n=1 Tax=Chryseobacterium sp. CCH4-E10 TaxID=1768758 RepID=UPI001E33AF02|nr:hypothetical protein [Chryseobacterium sp. CCH4-E10]
MEKLIIPRYQKLLGNEPLKMKIENFLTESEKNVKIFPYADVYVITEFSNSEDTQRYFEPLKPSVEYLLKQIKRDIMDKKISHSDSTSFLIDLLALSSCSHIYLNFLKNNSILKDFLGENLCINRSEVVKKVLLIQNL